jgi:fucose 4-O-acetylase-like acetyltransferase
VAAVFLYAGSLLYCVFQNLNNSRENILLLCCLVFSAIIEVLYQRYPEHFPTANLAAHQLGNPYVYYLKAISNTTLILLICRKLSGRGRVLAYFGKNSLILMALHMDVTIKIAWWIFPRLSIDFGEVINSVIIIAMELLMFAVMIPIINRYFPFILRYPSNKKIGC